ncbi:MAG TPA: hypothetical protein QGF05_05585 [Dehalococcoidia bacterium]|nr:hypothetical protein [Dehalococcoidia bacterium]
MAHDEQYCYCDIKPMEDTTDTLKRLARKAARKVNAVDDLTERERGLLTCVLAIRELGYVLRESMDEEGQIFAGFLGDGVLMIPGDDPWHCIDEFTECVLDGVGELERFDREAAEWRKQKKDLLDDLAETARLTGEVAAVDLETGPHRPQ